MSAPYGDAQQQQQIPSAVWCDAADLACDGCSKAKSLSNKRLYRLGVLLAVMVIPLSFLVGVKRSASGEVAAASAKKQKTTPLAAYQQAQEHLRSQNARHVRK